MRATQRPRSSLVQGTIAALYIGVRVCIDRAALGTPMSLIINDDGTFEWGDGSQCEVCLFDRDKCAAPLEDIMRLAGAPAEVITVPSPAQAAAFTQLGLDPRTVPWFMAMSREQFSDRIRAISQLIQDVLCDTRLTEYVKTYGQCRKFLQGLSRPTIDASLLRQFAHETDSGLSVIKSIRSFTPDSEGLAPRITYNQIGTATGRLTVESGPSILTLPKQHKRMIRSACGGSVWEVDFVSLEPRFVLHVQGKTPPVDIYEDIRQRVFRGELERRVVKTATISALYGSSAELVSDLTGAGSTAKTIIRRVKEYFLSDELAARLSTETVSGPLHNYYGRPLIEMVRGVKPVKLVSHYVQSSCVDTALLGFSALCDKLKSLNARPIYVIHDAVLIDVPSGAESEFLEVCNVGIDLDVGHFELGVNKIS